ncbi:MAG: hypothetical protein ABI353_19205 [Isosphaeraceae bacterium]
MGKMPLAGGIDLVEPVWTVPGFHTQDGPAHLYNAHILVESLSPGSPFKAVYEVRWAPLPNRVGHLTLMALVATFPPWAADRAMLTLTLVGLATSIGWLRWRVQGWRGMSRAAPWATLLAMNVAWLWGFSSFLIGSCLFALTLGAWWSARDRFGPRAAATLTALLVVGYFCHLVSLGLTAVGLIMLALATPGPNRMRRIGWTVAALSVLAPLAVVYRTLAGPGQPLRPTWNLLAGPPSLANWGAHLTWVDPLTLARKTLVPFLGFRPGWAALIVPAAWFVLALMVLALATFRQGRLGRDGAIARRGWLAAALVLLAGGLVGPDSLGPAHGEFLPQRVALLGLIALTPVLDFGGPGRLNRLAGGLLIVALGLQSAFVWDYAVRSSRLAAEFLQARQHVGQRERVGTLLLDLRGPYRANPLLHMDCLLGLGNGNILWSNYEAAHYYFPVHVRQDVPHPPELEFERISILDDPADADVRARRWEALLARHQGEIDRLVIWGDDPHLDAITARWFTPLAREGRVRVLRNTR